MCFFIICFYLQNLSSAPLNIEINEGIQTTPYQTGDVDKNISTSFVQTIETSEIRDSQLDLGRVIENSSGLKIRRTGGIGSYSQISIRGKSPNQVMVYVDGMLLNNASGGSVDLSQIPINQIARIEIYKDVIPIEFSEASNGGVINIITHRTKSQKSSQIRTGMGSFETLNLGINHFNYYKDWQFVLTGGYIRSKNDFSFNYENGTPNNPYDDETQQRLNNELHQYNFVAKAKYKIDNYQSIQYQGEIFNKNKQVPSFSNSSATNTFLSYDNKYFAIKYINNRINSDKLELSSDIKLRLKDTLYDDSEKQIGLVKRLVDQRTKLVSGKVYAKYNENSFQIIGNSSLRYEYLTSDDFYEPENSRSNKRLTFATALQGNLFFYNKKLIVSPAIRSFVTNDNFSGETSNESLNKNHISKTYHTTTSQIGVRYQLWSNTSLKINAGKYYRLPNYIELFGARGYIGSNETLRPEKGINVDVGFEHLGYPKSELLTKFNWNLSLYHSTINDEIVYSYDARGIGKPSNNAKSTITGLENNITWEFFYTLDLVSNTTFHLPLNRSDPNNTTLLPSRPPWSQTTRIVIDQNPVNFYIEHILESSFYFDTAQRLPGKQKSIFNTGIKLTSKKIQYSFTLNNLFSQQNKDFYYQVIPGLSAFLSINFNLN